MKLRVSLTLFGLFACSSHLVAGDYNHLVLEKIASMPRAGTYAKYRKDLPEKDRFGDLYSTVTSLDSSIKVGLGGALKVSPEAAATYSFCSSATYLLFCDVISDLQKEGVVAADRGLSRELADVGACEEVIHGKLDGVGIFGHWNADGPGTAVLFERLDLGTNYSGLSHAKPGDFLKIFWNDSIGKGERGHLVVYLGKNESGDAIQVWSSNMENADGSAGYGTMWIKTGRIKRSVLSRLERPQNLSRWLAFSEEEKTSEYLVRIRQTGSTGEEMLAVTKSVK
ncbi:MAG: hypothetical protein P1U87_17595 [Verrucomicrobiales bacterium]|nr:hypothetical protein [Verrucomicrobiales bacterium]